MSTMDALNDTVFLDLHRNWNQKTYRCHIGLVRDTDGGFSAIVLNLPGVGSCGDTEEDAILNCREAIRGALESYVEAKEAIPWLDPNSYAIPKGAALKWIVVNA